MQRHFVGAGLLLADKLCAPAGVAHPAAGKAPVWLGCAAGEQGRADEGAGTEGPFSPGAGAGRLCREGAAGAEREVSLCEGIQGMKKGAGEKY